MDLFGGDFSEKEWDSLLSEFTPEGGGMLSAQDDSDPLALVPLTGTYDVIRQELLRKLRAGVPGVELDGLTIRVRDVTSFKRLLTEISSANTATRRGWDLTEASSYEKQCRRLALRKCRQDWLLMTAGAQPPASTAAVKRQRAQEEGGFATRAELGQLTDRVDALEVQALAPLGLCVPAPDPLAKRDIAYWYPLTPGCNPPGAGDLVYITNDLTLSLTKPSGQAACVCGVVVDPEQPWVKVGTPPPHAIHTYRLVCIKGQVPVCVEEWGGLLSCPPLPGSLLVPHPTTPGVASPLPSHLGHDCVIGQVVSTLHTGPGVKGKQRVLAHVHMPAVQVQPRYGEVIERAQWLPAPARTVATQAVNSGVAGFTARLLTLLLFAWLLVPVCVPAPGATTLLPSPPASCGGDSVTVCVHAHTSAGHLLISQHTLPLVTAAAPTGYVSPAPSAADESTAAKTESGETAALTITVEGLGAFLPLSWYVAPVNATASASVAITPTPSHTPTLVPV